MSEKRHWYALSFNYQGRGAMGHACTYMGYAEQLVTVPRIESAKVAAGVPENANAVLIGLAYLGHMTKDEVTTLE
ncbi:MAG: hypothetical protein KJZ90_03410 [Rhodocyclaceae bacterium]|nr:hypothetical protein [Rhodocyclaceae bacterium]